MSHVTDSMTASSFALLIQSWREREGEREWSCINPRAGRILPIAIGERWRRLISLCEVYGSLELIGGLDRRRGWAVITVVTPVVAAVAGLPSPPASCFLRGGEKTRTKRWYRVVDFVWLFWNRGLGSQTIDESIKTIQHLFFKPGLLIVSSVVMDSLAVASHYVLFHSSRSVGLYVTVEFLILGMLLLCFTSKFFLNFLQLSSSSLIMSSAYPVSFYFT